MEQGCTWGVQLVSCFRAPPGVLQVSVLRDRPAAGTGKETHDARWGCQDVVGAARTGAQLKSPPFNRRAEGGWGRAARATGAAVPESRLKGGQVQSWGARLRAHCCKGTVARRAQCVWGTGSRPLEAELMMERKWSHWKECKPSSLLSCSFCTIFWASPG